MIFRNALTRNMQPALTSQHFLSTQHMLLMHPRSSIIYSNSHPYPHLAFLKSTLLIRRYVGANQRHG